MTALDGLPDPLRHAIDQTIAAERLEGWRPTDEHVDALVRLLCDEVPFGEYQRRTEPATRRTVTRRAGTTGRSSVAIGPI